MYTLRVRALASHEEMLIPHYKVYGDVLLYLLLKWFLTVDLWYVKAFNLCLQMNKLFAKSDNGHILTIVNTCSTDNNYETMPGFVLVAI